MTPTEFLRSRNIIAKNKSDLMIGFDNATEESLIELLETYHKSELKCVKCGKTFVPRLMKPLTICDKCANSIAL